MELKRQDDSGKEKEYLTFTSPSGMFSFEISKKRYEELKEGQEPKTLLERFLVNIEEEKREKEQMREAEARRVSKEREVLEERTVPETDDRVR